MIFGKNPGEIICDRTLDHLHIGWDDDGFVFLFTPDMSDTSNHYHIEMNEEQALRLRDFLNKKLLELNGNRGESND
ncbi:MAG: hypothetical protein ABL952_07590 [Pyrinomonadaceae bacterium]